MAQTARTPKIIEVDIAQLESGLYVLTFDGQPRGDAAKFDYREARTAAASWDGKDAGYWAGPDWVDAEYRCAWGPITAKSGGC